MYFVIFTKGTRIKRISYESWFDFICIALFLSSILPCDEWEKVVAHTIACFVSKTRICTLVALVEAKVATKVTISKDTEKSGIYDGNQIIQSKINLKKIYYFYNTIKYIIMSLNWARHLFFLVKKNHFLFNLASLIVWTFFGIWKTNVWSTM